MKKLLVCLMALAMLMTCAALAEIKVESIPMERSIYISDATNCYYTRVDGGYQLFDADGNAISAVYSDITAKDGGLYYEYPGSGLNYIGVLDSKGQVITQPMYGEFYTYDNGWALGYVLEPVAGEAGDFKDSDNHWYNAVRTDVFYDGRVIGSLTREEYIPTYTEGVSGNYFYVKQTSEVGFFLDKDFNKYAVNGYMYTSSEFEYDYKTKSVTHIPTQQKAFCPECTLTEADVSCPVWYDDNTDTLIDLKGNVIKTGVMYDTIYQAGDYLRIRHNGKYGVMDLEGNVIIQPQYAEIPNYYGIFPNGIQAAVTPEGHLHFLDLQGNVIAKAEYELSSSDYKGLSYNSPFVAVKNMGKVIVITAEMGELPTTYEDFNQVGTNQKIMMVKKDGLWGAIDAKGQTVLPFVHRYAPEISDDGSIAYGQNENREYILYRISYTEAAVPENWTETRYSDDGSAPVLAEGAWECVCGAINTGKYCGFCGVKMPEPTPTPTPAPTPEPTPTAVPAVQGAWICSCGTENSGKFCAECGQKKPEPTPTPMPDGSWDCVCGSHNNGKFCPECGSPKPVAEPQCLNCGYKPEGAAPKFCPECGTKF